MSRDYVKKFTDYLQNIPTAQRPPGNAAAAAAADGNDAGGHSNTRASPVVSHRPQSKPLINKPAARKPTGKGQTGAVGPVRRPVWVVPASRSLLPPAADAREEATGGRKFVRTCCPPADHDSRRPTRRVDCRWAGDGKNPHHPPPTPSPSPTVISAEECPRTPAPSGGGRASARATVGGNGDGGLGDNVNQQRSPGSAQGRETRSAEADEGRHDKRERKRTSEEFRDRQSSSWAGMLANAHPGTEPTAGKRKNANPPPPVTNGDTAELSNDDVDDDDDESVLEPASLSSSGHRKQQLFTFQPVRTLQFLTLELTTKIRDLGPEHRPLYRIGKELSDVVKILTQQQHYPEPSRINASQSRPKAGAEQIDCATCQTLQQTVKDDRARHAQESARLSEQVQLLKERLEGAKTMESTVLEQCQRLEEQFHELKGAKEEKIDRLRERLRAAREREQTLERERDALETRLMETLAANERLEFLLHAQDRNISRAKSELGAIHQLSSKQIRFLDDPDDTGRPSASVVSLRHRRRPVGSETSTSNIGLSRKESLDFSDHPPEKSAPDSTPNGSFVACSCSASRKSSARKSASSDATFTLLTASESEDGEAERVVSGRAIHYGRDDNHQRHQQQAIGKSTEASTSNYSTGRLHRKFGEAEKALSPRAEAIHRGDVNGRAVEWPDEDKNHPRPTQPGPEKPDAADYDDADDERRKKIDGTTFDDGGRSSRSSISGHHQPATLDDHQKFVAELAENVTLPSSPTPFRSDISTVSQLSEASEFLFDGTRLETPC